jgi:hypothetical protein
MLYLRIRAFQPTNVFEFNSAMGFTSMVILQALADNGHGTLTSMDTFAMPWPYVLPPLFKSRLVQYAGNNRDNLALIFASHVRFDYIHIGARGNV